MIVNIDCQSAKIYNYPGAKLMTASGRVFLQRFNRWWEDSVGTWASGVLGWIKNRKQAEYQHSSFSSPWLEKQGDQITFLPLFPSCHNALSLLKLWATIRPSFFKVAFSQVFCCTYGKSKYHTSLWRVRNGWNLCSVAGLTCLYSVIPHLASTWA